MREGESNKCGGSKLVEVWVEERRSRITGRAYLVRKAGSRRKGKGGGEERKRRGWR